MGSWCHDGTRDELEELGEAVRTSTDPDGLPQHEETHVGQWPDFCRLKEETNTESGWDNRQDEQGKLDYLQGGVQGASFERSWSFIEDLQDPDGTSVSSYGKS